MTDSSIIQDARAVLAKWRDGSTPGPWQTHRHRYNADDELDIVVPDAREFDGISPLRTEGSYAADYGYFRSEADAHLIVGTAGNPELLDAIDEGLRQYGTLPDRSVPSFIKRIAAAIVAANERMSA